LYFEIKDVFYSDDNDNNSDDDDDDDDANDVFDDCVVALWGDEQRQRLTDLIEDHGGIVVNKLNSRVCLYIDYHCCCCFYNNDDDFVLCLYVLACICFANFKSTKNRLLTLYY
jgi:hypothetical protein